MNFLKNLVWKCRNYRARTVFLFIFITCLFFFNSDFLTVNKYSSNNIPVCASSYESHRKAVDRYYEKRKHWKTSNLGAILFKNIDNQVFTHSSRTNKTYLVLIWKYWDWLKKRHIYNFSSAKRPVNIFEGCSVSNCRFSGNDTDLTTADAVVIHMQRGVLPTLKDRKPHQRWVFLSDESPMNTFSLSKSSVKLSQLSNVFNWTMTYRSDADIPVPYGRTIPLQNPIVIESNDPEIILSQLVPAWNEKQFAVLTMALISNCSVKKRMQFVASLMKFIKVDIFGKCSEVKKNKNVCPGHFRADCNLASNYLFYLVLENSNNCRQYLTEKGFYHALSKGAIPIVMGASLNDCKDLLPPDSYIHVDQFKSVKDLTNHMQEVALSYDKILSYHLWRRHFDVVNEHGYFKTRSYHYCRICEALNYNDGEKKSYNLEDLNNFFAKNVSCEVSLTQDVTSAKPLSVTKSLHTTTTKITTLHTTLKTTAKTTSSTEHNDINDIKFRDMKKFT